MKAKEDFVYLPKFNYNDILNTGENIKGQAILTKKYFFILPDKATDPIGITNRDLYDKKYFENAKQNFENLELVQFETEMVASLPQKYVRPFSNFEKFEINVGFFIFGGLRMKLVGEKITSAYIGNAENRKMVKEFYDKVVK